MPRYEFKCNACKETFELTMTMKERMASQIVCPGCSSNDVLPQYSVSSITEGKAGSGQSCGSQSCSSCGGQCHCH
jgi:putative FmdB family regulatory protein